MSDPEVRLTNWYGVEKDTTDKWRLLSKESLSEIRIMAGSIFKASHFSAVAFAMIREIEEMGESLIELADLLVSATEKNPEKLFGLSDKTIELVTKYREE